MHMRGLIPVLLVMAFLVVLTWWQRRFQGAGIPGAEKVDPLLEEGTIALATSETVVPSPVLLEEEWWQNLSSLHQLQLALHLAKKASLVWERFAALQVVSYRAAPSGPVTIIETDLLQKTLDEIIYHTQQHFPGSEAGKINHYHKLFIGPVLALKDGIWLCAYPVKKVVLSVYYILQSIIEQHNSAAHENFLSEAINAALECMELSNLYTREEIAAFLAEYRSRL